jgi:hypothetical protein
MIFRTTLIKRAYRLDQMRHMAADAGWSQIRIDSDAMGFEAWLEG